MADPDEIARQRVRQREAQAAQERATKEQRSQAEYQRKLAGLQTAPRELARRLVESGLDWWGEVGVQTLNRRGKIKSSEIRAGYWLGRWTTGSDREPDREHRLYLLTDGSIVYTSEKKPIAGRPIEGPPPVGSVVQATGPDQHEIYEGLRRLRESLETGTISGVIYPLTANPENSPHLNWAARQT